MKFIIEDFYKSRPPRIYTEYAPAIRSERHGLIVAEGEYEMNNNEPFIVASRGRNPENPSDRTAGIHLEQRLEPRLDGTTNTLTSVQKDNYVAIPGENGLRLRKLTPKECWRLMGFDDDCYERAANVNSNTQLYKQAGNSIVVNVLCEIVKCLNLSVDLGIKAEDQMQIIEPCVLKSVRTEYGKSIRKDYEAGRVKESRHNMTTLVPRTDGVSNTLTSVQKDNYVAIPDENGLRLRKLTPLECWRLMGFDDDCYERAASVNSNTQLYKQAGNSIVVNVLCEIVKRLAVSVDLGINTEAEETEESTEQVFVQLEFPM